MNNYLCGNTILRPAHQEISRWPHWYDGWIHGPQDSGRAAMRCMPPCAQCATSRALCAKWAPARAARMADTRRAPRGAAPECGPLAREEPGSGARGIAAVRRQARSGEEARESAADASAQAHQAGRPEVFAVHRLRCPVSALCDAIRPSRPGRQAFQRRHCNPAMGRGLGGNSQVRSSLRQLPYGAHVRPGIPGAERRLSDG